MRVRDAAVSSSEFDPSADQFLTPQLCREHCPVPFTARILDMDLRDNTVEELRAMYRAYAACEPTQITCIVTRMDDVDKFAALLDLARELAE